MSDFETVRRWQTIKELAHGTGIEIRAETTGILVIDHMSSLKNRFKTLPEVTAFINGVLHGQRRKSLNDG